MKIPLDQGREIVHALASSHRDHLAPTARSWLDWAPSADNPGAARLILGMVQSLSAERRVEADRDATMMEE